MNNKAVTVSPILLIQLKSMIVEAELILRQIFSLISNRTSEDLSHLMPSIHFSTYISSICSEYETCNR